MKMLSWVIHRSDMRAGASKQPRQRSDGSVRVHLPPQGSGRIKGDERLPCPSREVLCQAGGSPSGRRHWSHRPPAGRINNVPSDGGIGTAGGYVYVPCALPCCSFKTKTLQGLDGDSPLADTESIYPDTSSMTDLAQLSRSMQQGKFRNSHSETLLSQHQNVSADEPTANDRGSVSSLASATGDTTDALNPFLKSQSDSVIGSPVVKEGAVPSSAAAQPNGPLGGGGAGNAAARIVTFASDRIVPQSLSQTSFHPIPIQSGFSSMKRGISNFMSSVDAALKQSGQVTGNLDPACKECQLHAEVTRIAMLRKTFTLTSQLVLVLDDASDSYSIRSDGSSDSSDNFVVLQSENADQSHPYDSLAVFRTHKGGSGSSLIAAAAAASSSNSASAAELEVAVEVREDTPTSEHSSAPITTASLMSSNHVRQRDLAVVTFHINDLELIQQSVESSSSIRLQASHLSCNECTSISREEFQVCDSTFLTRSGD